MTPSGNTVCRLNLAVDYLFYTSVGSSSEVVTRNELSTILAEVNSIYSVTDFNFDRTADGVSFYVADITIYTSPNQPSSAYSQPSINVNSFLDLWSQVRDPAWWCHMTCLYCCIDYTNMSSTAVLYYCIDYTNSLVQLDHTNSLVQLDYTNSLVQLDHTNSLVQLDNTNSLVQLDYTNSLVQLDYTNSLVQLDHTNTVEPVYCGHHWGKIFWLL